MGIIPMVREGRETWQIEAITGEKETAAGTVTATLIEGAVIIARGATGTGTGTGTEGTETVAIGDTDARAMRHCDSFLYI